MPDSKPNPTMTAQPASGWNTNLVAAICEHCDWRFLVPPDSLPRQCPNCFQDRLSPLGQVEDGMVDQSSPERFIPFGLTPEQLGQSIQAFARGIWFAPTDLNPANLTERLQQVFLPLWLVDSEVEATWQAEAGFDYDVVSHRDRYDQKKGGWNSQQVTETRIRWEPRLGRLKRTYHNTAAPALEEYAALRQKLGVYDLKLAQPYRAEAIRNVSSRLPNRAPADAWPDARSEVQQAAGDECRRACRADHWREFRWQAAFGSQNWTLLLLPVYTSYYLDDDNHLHPLLIHGQNGRVSGLRRASMKRAQRVAIIFLVIGVIIFVLGLLGVIISLVLPRLFVIAGIGLLTAFIIGVLGLVPVAIAWQFNRTHRA